MKSQRLKYPFNENERLFRTLQDCRWYLSKDNTRVVKDIRDVIVVLCIHEIEITEKLYNMLLEIIPNLYTENSYPIGYVDISKSSVLDLFIDLGLGSYKTKLRIYVRSRPQYIRKGCLILLPGDLMDLKAYRRIYHFSKGKEGAPRHLMFEVKEYKEVNRLLTAHVYIQRCMITI
jgi:hypothetical protein